MQNFHRGHIVNVKKEAVAKYPKWYGSPITGGVVLKVTDDEVELCLNYIPDLPTAVVSAQDIEIVGFHPAYR